MNDTRFAIVTHNDTNYQDLAKLTVDQNKRLYADKWGYDLDQQTSGFQKPYGFDKIRQLQRLMHSDKDYDWLFWCGCDTMITNFTLPLTNFIDDRYHFIIATDVNGINADSFFIRNSQSGRTYLDMILTYESKYRNHHFYEQQIMTDTYPICFGFIKLVPQKLINAYDYKLYPEHTDHRDKLGVDGNWEQGDFLIHWPGTRLEKRLELANYYMDKVIK